MPDAPNSSILGAFIVGVSSESVGHHFSQAAADDICANTYPSAGQNLAIQSGMENGLYLGETLLWRLRYTRAINFTVGHCDPPFVADGPFPQGTPVADLIPEGALPIEIPRFFKFEGRMASNAETLCGGLFSHCAGPRTTSPIDPFTFAAATITYQALVNREGEGAGSGYNMTAGMNVVVNLPEAEVRMNSNGLAEMNAFPGVIDLPFCRGQAPNKVCYRRIAGSHAFGVNSGALRSQETPITHFQFDINMAADDAGLSRSQAGNIVILQSTGAAPFEIQTSPFADGRITALRARSQSDFSMGTLIVALKDLQPPPRRQIIPVDAGDRHLNFQWIAPGDDGDEGRASGYDIRFRLSQNGEFDFETAPPLFSQSGDGDDDLSPSPAGLADGVSIAGLEPETTYCIGVNAFDQSGQESGPFVGCAVTLPPQQFKLASAEQISVNGTLLPEIEFSSTREEITLERLVGANPRLTLMKSSAANSGLIPVSNFFAVEPSGLALNPPASIVIRFDSATVVAAGIDPNSLRIRESTGTASDS